MTPDEFGTIARAVAKIANDDVIVDATAIRALNLTAVPVIPFIHQTLAQAITENPALFDMADWYCGTSACRAGWIVKLAGPVGKALERAIDITAAPSATGHAAALIYCASDITLDEIPPWFQPTPDALVDIYMKAADERARHTPAPYAGTIYDLHGRPLP